MAPTRRKSGSGKANTRLSPAQRKYESAIENLQKRLSSRLWLIFSIPFLIIVFLSLYARALDSRVKALESLEQVDTIERLYQKTHNVTSAIDFYDKLVKERPYPQALVRLAALYYTRGEEDDLTKAFDLLERAKKMDYWEAYSQLVTIYTITEKNEKKAIEEGAKALQHNPYDAITYNNLAWIYATSTDQGIRNLAKAKDYAQKAVKFTLRQEPSYLDTLLRVYSEMKKPDLVSAVQEEIKAIGTGANKAQASCDRQDRQGERIPPATTKEEGNEKENDFISGTAS